MQSDLTSRPPTNVALVIDTLERGGAERVLVSLANGLDRSRFRVHVVVTRRPGSLASELAGDVSIHSLDRRTRWDLGALRRLARLIEQNDVALLHTHSHTSAYLVPLARLLSRKRCLHVMHDHHGPIEGSLVLQLLDRLLLTNVDYYFAVSARLKQYAARWLRIPAERAEHLANAVSVPDRARPPKPLVFTVVQVASVTPAKNQQMAVAIAARLRSTLPEFRWLIIGRMASRYAEACRRAVDRAGVGRHLLFLGEREDVADLLASAHVGVLTSQYEAFPIALLEYMAARLPVVVTDVGECGRVVRASAGGTVVAAQDVPGFANAIQQLAADAKLSDAAGKANLRYVRSHYSVEAMVQRVEQVYDALLSGEQVQRRSSNSSEA